jgi:hypothetical protein
LYGYGRGGQKISRSIISLPKDRFFLFKSVLTTRLSSQRSKEIGCKDSSGLQEGMPNSFAATHKNARILRII